MTVSEYLTRQFEQFFGAGEGPIRIFFAPGRVNLIGEHTDYTGGYVFPAALSYGTYAAIRLRPDGRIRLASTSFAKRVEFDVNDVVYRTEDEWANYPKGVIRGFLEQGNRLSGCDMLFHGTIPSGAGLSSSASIELATAVALKTLHHIRESMLELVKMSQAAENQFVGVNCGIMDQFAVGMGKADHAVILKCDTLDYRYAPLQLGDYQLVITNTNKRRELADSKYNERRQQCEEGFQIIQPHLSSVSSLGDVTPEQWDKVANYVDSPVIRMRLQHVVNENARVLASVKALEKGDLHEFGRLMIQSHESLRDLYEVTGYELDVLFAEARQVKGCIGTRMTGAGFGGCTVSLVHKDATEEFQQSVLRGYQAKTGLNPDFYISEIGDGAREITEEVESCLF